MNEEKSQTPPAWKIILAGALVLFAIVLGAVHFNQDPDTDNNPPRETIEKTDTAKISAGIDSVISGFGVDVKWIREAKTKVSSFSKIILLPKDLTLMNVNLDLSKYFDGRKLTVLTEENPRSGILKMEVFAKTDTSLNLIGNIQLEHSDSVKRSCADVCIVLDSIDRMSLKDVEDIRESGIDLPVIIPLSNDKADYQSLITGSDFEYIMELTYGGENSFESDFRDGMNEKEIKSKIRSLYLSFPKVSVVILRNNGGSDALKRLITKEMSEYGLKILPENTSERMYFNEGKPLLLLSAIRDKCNSGVSSFCIITSMNRNELDEFSKASWSLRKKGYKFIGMNDYLKKQSNLEKRDSIVSK